MLLFSSEGEPYSILRGKGKSRAVLGAGAIEGSGESEFELFLVCFNGRNPVLCAIYSV